MVEYYLNLDSIFTSLADPTRRDILFRVSEKELSISEIAKSYALTFAAISKHVKILENARLVIKRRQGKEQLVQAVPQTLAVASHHLTRYEAAWNARIDALETLLQAEGHSPS